MSEKKIEYYNFPIQLLKGFMDDPAASLEKITAYNIYFWSYDWKNDDGSHESDLIPTDRVLKFLRLADNAYMNNLWGLGEMIYNSIPDKCPKVGIRRDVLIDYWSNIESKSKYDLIALVAHLALKSIIGKSRWKKVHYDFWFSRMDGSAKRISRCELSPSIAEFHTKYKRGKIRDKLELHWNLQWVKSGNKNLNFRGLIVSYKMTHIELYEKAVSLKEDSQLKRMKNKKKLELEQYLKRKETNK